MQRRRRHASKSSIAPQSWQDQRGRPAPKTSAVKTAGERRIAERMADDVGWLQGSSGLGLRRHPIAENHFALRRLARSELLKQKLADVSLKRSSGRPQSVP